MMPGTDETEIDEQGNAQVVEDSPFDGNLVLALHLILRPRYFYA